MWPLQRNPYELDMFGSTQRMRTNFNDLQIPEQIGPTELTGVDTSGYPRPPLPFGQQAPPEIAPPPMPPPTPSAPPPQMAEPPPIGPPPVSSNALMDPSIPVPTPPEIPSVGPGMSMPGIDVESEMAKYQPEHAASDKFNQLIGQYPGREKPGLFQTIAASLSAFGPGGHNTGQEVMHGDYNRQVADWKNQTATAQQAANLERYQNVNERTLRYQTVTAQLRESADRARAENNQRKADIAEQRMQIYRHKTLNPTVKIVKVPGGNLMFDDGKGNLRDSGISSGLMTRMDEIELGIEGRKEVAGVQHGYKMDEIAQRDENLTKQKDKAQKREFSPYGRGAGTGGETGYMKPSQQIAMERANADRHKNTNPEDGQWIHWDGSHVVVDPPDPNPDTRPDSERSWYDKKRAGPSPEQHKRITSAIYGPMQGDIAADKNRGAFTPPDPEAAKYNKTLPPNSPFHYVKNPNYRGKPGEDYWIPVRKQ